MCQSEIRPDTDANDAVTIVLHNSRTQEEHLGAARSIVVTEARAGNRAVAQELASALRLQEQATIRLNVAFSELVTADRA